MKIGDIIRNIFFKKGEVHKIGIFTPHESLPVKQDVFRQFLLGFMVEKSVLL